MSTGVQAKELREVPSTDILKQIEKGEDIYYKNVRIIGELNLSKIELENVTIARSTEEIKNYSLKEELKIVESKIEIYSSVFEDDIYFFNTKFRDFFFVTNADFLGKTDFGGANFCADTCFQGADFNDNATFENADFSGDAYFEHADFNDNVTFERADFSGDAYFKYANFSDNVFFINVDFLSDAYFEHADFNDNATFERADFSGDAYFSDVKFRDEVSFDYTKFNKVYFIETLFTFVSFKELEFYRIKVNWSSLNDRLVFDGPTYTKLINNFREMEQFDDADAAYYQYRRLSQANKKWSFSKLLDVLAWLSCGYGVKPGYPLIWSLILIVAFALVYWTGNDIKFMYALSLSLHTYIPSGSDGYPKNFYPTLRMIEGFLGWILLTFLIIVLAKQGIRP
jgi:hypothetical protein